MNPYISNPNRIEFVITGACTGRCKHCSESEHLSCNDHIDCSKAVTAIQDICALYHIESLMTFGGEPLLYPETVCAIHEAACKLNIPKRQLITNGYFSKDPARIREVAQMLSHAGVNDILLSADAFHQETIPLEPVLQFAESLCKEHLPVRVHPAWLVSPDDNNPYNQQTRTILQAFEARNIHISEGNIIFPAGNALLYLAEYFNEKTDCTNPYEEDPRDVRTICFSANGDVLGSNIYSRPITDIIRTYSVSS